MKAQATYWTREAPPTPELSDLPPGTFAGDATAWQSLSPGYRRAIYTDAVRRTRLMYALVAMLKK